MAEVIKVAELTIDVDKAIKSQQRFASEVKRLKALQKQLKDSGQESSEAFAKNDAALQNLNKSYRDSRKLTASLLAVNKDFERTLSAENKSNLELLDSRRQLQEIQKSIVGDTQEEIEARDLINNAIDEQTEALRGQSSEFVAAKDGIGEYQKAIENAVPANSVLGRAISGVKSALNVVTPIYNAYSGTVRESVDGILNAARGTEGLTKAQKAGVITTNLWTNGLRLLKVALAATGIGLVLVALGSLVSFLASTQRGIDAVNSVLKPLEVIFKRLIGTIQNFGETLFDALSDPQQLIADIGDSIKRNLETRFNAVVRILRNIADFNFDNLGEDLVEAATGVEDLAGKAAAAFGQARDFINESIDLGNQLADLTVRIEQSEARLVLRRAELQNLIKADNKIAEDTSKTQREREAAAERTLRNSEQLLAAEQEILALKIEQKEIENSLNDTSREDIKELNELRAEAIQKETEQLELQTTQQNKLNTIRREIAAERSRAADEQLAKEREAALAAVKNAELELDIFKETNAEKLAIDGELNRARIDAAVAAANFIRDAELDILEDKLAKGIISEKEAQLARLENDRAFREKSQELEQEFFDQQEEKRIEREQAATERAEFDLESEQELRLAKAESEAEFRQLQLEQREQQELAAAEKIGAGTAAIEKRYAIQRANIERALKVQKADLYAEAFGTFSDITDKSTAVSKAAGIAQATISTYTGAAKNLELGYPLGPIFAALTIAQGLAQVANIAGVKFAQGGIQEVGGKSHAAGGTKFVGSDGTRFEAERGELIGVMNKRAAAAFMSFNDQYRSGRSSRGRYAGGGTFTAGNPALRQSAGLNGADVPGIDYDLLAYKVGEANRKLPPGVLDVRDFYEVDRRVRVVEGGANV